jgi:O-antigen/teichoic acid export membrane protein
LSRLRWNLSANVLASVWLAVLALAVTPIYVNLLGVERYGLVGFYASWVAILGVLDVGISATAMRETAWLSARPETSGAVPSLLLSLELVYWVIIVCVGCGLLLAALFFGSQWFSTTTVSPDTIRQALLLMVVSLVVQVPSGLYAAGLMGLQRQVESSTLLAFFGTVRSVGAVVVLWSIADVRAFFVWQILASALQTTIMRKAMRRRIRSVDHPAQFSLGLLRSVTEFAGGMTLITALGVLIMQMDKLVLSRMTSLEAFGFYVLAWTVASALLRIAAPLLQAFNPHFTDLVSKGDERALAKHVRLANQLMSTLVLPPAALLVLLPRQILFAWVGRPGVAQSAAPLLSLLAVGTLLNACSYPTLTVLYSRKELRPVIATNLIAAVCLVPLLIEGVRTFGATGAAACWVLYGMATYVAYQCYGLPGLPDTNVLTSVASDFIAPALVSFGIAGIGWYWSAQADGRAQTTALVACALVTGWAAALISCGELRTLAMQSLRSTTTIAARSA